MARAAIRWLSGLFTTARGDPAQLAAWLFVAGVVGYVVVYPWTLVRYPPITDLPFHAAQTSILRHYLDPAWHFREQFSLHPLEVPYASMYGIGALAALFMPITTATKVMGVAMLLLPPIGLAVLLSGMKKSPLLGILGLSITWCTLTQWGFLNFVGAIGLFAMAMGFALKVVEEPTRSRRIGLGLTLVAIFFTHIYRFPFAVLAVLLTGVVMLPATRRFRPLLAPLLPACLLFLVWLTFRPRGDAMALSDLSFTPERLADFGKHLFGSFKPPEGAKPTEVGNEERAVATRMLIALLVVGAACAAHAFAGRRSKAAASDDPAAPSRVWIRGVTALPLIVVGGLLLAYVVLPLQIGRWWYVYPREMATAAFIALSLVPDLPRGWTHRAVILALAAVAVVPMASFIARQWRAFETLTADYRAIVQHVPPAPKLHYLIFARQGIGKRVSAFLHLPAWIQAQRGGWLGFHFVSWNHSPIRYRADGVVPPQLPDRFEWTPQHFRVLEHGPFFDTFLVRHTIDPSRLFEADTSVQLVRNEGTWWLYRRR